MVNQYLPFHADGYWSLSAIVPLDQYTEHRKECKWVNIDRLISINQVPQIGHNVIRKTSRHEWAPVVSKVLKGSNAHMHNTPPLYHKVFIYWALGVIAIWGFWWVTSGR